MTPAFAARLSRPQQRALAIGLMAAAVVLVLAVILAPILLLHRHYDAAIDDLTDRVERYRRVAAQAPELRRALELMKDKDGRRFYLKNTAPNLAGAELAQTSFLFRLGASPEFIVSAENAMVFFRQLIETAQKARDGIN